MADSDREDRLRQALSFVDQSSIGDAISRLEGERHYRARATRVALELLGYSALRGALTTARGRVRTAGYPLPPSRSLLWQLARYTELAAAREMATKWDRYTDRDFPADMSELVRVLRDSSAEEVPSAPILDLIYPWVAEDLPSAHHDVVVNQALFGERRGSSSEAELSHRIGALYCGYLAALWWRHLVVAEVVASSTDPPESLDEAAETLSAEAVNRTRGPAEAFAGALGLLIDGPNAGLSEDEEATVRAHLNSLRGYYTSPVEVPRVLIQKPIEEIVRILAGRLVLGEAAKLALVSLGARPPEVVEAVLEQLNAAIRSVARWDAQDNMDVRAETEQLLATREAVSDAVDLFDDLELAEVSQATAGKSRLDSARDEFAKAFGKRLGEGAAVALVGSVGAIAIATSGTWTSAAARLLQWIVEYLPWAI